MDSFSLLYDLWVLGWEYLRMGAVTQLLEAKKHEDSFIPILHLGWKIQRLGLLPGILSSGL